MLLLKETLSFREIFENLARQISVKNGERERQMKTKTKEITSLHLRKSIGAMKKRKNNSARRWWLGFPVGVTIAILCANLSVAYGAPVETITVRSGQVGGVPGTVGAPDDIVRFNPGGNPSSSPLLPVPFTPAFFAATALGSPATVISPHPVWFPALPTDPLARWIDFALLPSGGGLGEDGSALYAVPFMVTSTTITSATIKVEGGADDAVGDACCGGPNPAGLYINTVSTGFQLIYDPATAFNFAVPRTHFQDITGLITPGLNYLFFYQRDGAGAVSGLIFSATITVNGCVRTQGYWKNHTPAWPPFGASLTLGTVSYSPAQLLAILEQPVQGNGLISLAHQLIAAKLNQANGAPTPATVQTAINAADALIGGLVVPPIGSGYLQPSQTSLLTNTLDIYNNGQLSGGPPHCGD